MKKHLRQHIPKVRSKKGITLVEILVGVTIIVIVFGATLGAMTQGYSGTLRNADEDKAAALAGSVCDTVATSIKKLNMENADDLESYFSDHADSENAVILAARSVVSSIDYLSTYNSVFTATGDYQFAIDFDKGSSVQTASGENAGITGAVVTVSIRSARGYVRSSVFVPYGELV